LIVEQHIISFCNNEMWIIRELDEATVKENSTMLSIARIMYVIVRIVCKSGALFSCRALENKAGNNSIYNTIF